MDECFKWYNGLEKGEKRKQESVFRSPPLPEGGVFRPPPPLLFASLNLKLLTLGKRNSGKFHSEGSVFAPRKSHHVFGSESSVFAPH